MHRYAEYHLNTWLKRKNRKPLIIRGARQVGKSTLVRHFCIKQKLTLCEINLEQHHELDKIFKTLNPSRILQELTTITGQSPLQKAHLLFLDEVQATPHVLAALRYLYEKYPSLIIIAAGSLLDFALRQHQQSMPVGRIEYFHLGPMSFKEFLLACNEDYLVQLIDQFSFTTPWPQTAHQKLLEKQREYFFVGGMPEAVYSFTQETSLAAATQAHESILSTLKDDFNKYCKNSNELIRLQTLLKYLPAHIGEKIIYSRVSPTDKAREIKQAIELLALAKLCMRVYHSSCSGIPLEAQQSLETFKCLLVDIGLMNRALGLDWTAISTRGDQTLINEGGLAEQFIGQHLLYRNQGLYEPSLHYWLREKKSNNAEVDYVITSGDWIVPIEVKAGQSGTLRSLHQYIALKQPNIAIRFDANPPSNASYQHQIRLGNDNAKISYKMMSLPLYLVEAVLPLLEEMRKSS